MAKLAGKILPNRSGLVLKKRQILVIFEIRDNVYVHICIYTYMYMYIHINVYTYIYIHTQIYTYIYIISNFRYTRDRKSEVYAR